MPDIHDLPLVNAVLNCSSTVLLLAGYWSIRKRNIRLHHSLMIAAFAASCLFLVSYVIYHLQVGSVHFQGTGWVRPLYFTILSTHTVLAATIPFLATITLVRALRHAFQRHRAIARWTLPVWLYVSVTGVVIYLMVYQLYGPV